MVKVYLSGKLVLVANYHTLKDYFMTMKETV